MQISLQLIQTALSLSHFDERQVKKARRLMLPTAVLPEPPPEPDLTARMGSVLILFYQNEGQTNLVLTRRRDDLRIHAGQISFPGGGREGEESLVETALRETEEEIGVAASAVEIIGELTPAYIPPSNFFIYPFVGWYRPGSRDNGRPPFQKNPDEVDEILEFPVHRLLKQSARREEPRQIGGATISIPYFAVGEHKIWGATASILSEVVERLRLATNGQQELESNQPVHHDGVDAHR
jgi:8-oxo-dGTP pyrophosphatase MutT (NUDIX family)